MVLYWSIVLIVVSLAFILAGGYMLYSAITGKGIPPIDIKKSAGLWLQYKMRGIIGITFIIGGLAIFAIFIRNL